MKLNKLKDDIKFILERLVTNYIVCTVYLIDDYNYSEDSIREKEITKLIRNKANALDALDDNELLRLYYIAQTIYENYILPLNHEVVTAKAYPQHFEMFAIIDRFDFVTKLIQEEFK